jgi:type I restriction enzyme S subunit
VPYLRVANVQRGHLDLEEIKTIDATEDEISELELMPGDILLNEGGDIDKLGRGWVWSGEIPHCIHQNPVLRSRAASSEVEPRFLSHYANTFGQKFFFDAGAQTVNLASISMSKLKSLPVPCPPIEEQNEIMRRVNRLLALADSIEERARVAFKGSPTVASDSSKGVRWRAGPTEAELAEAEGREFESAEELRRRVMATPIAAASAVWRDANEAKGPIPEYGGGRDMSNVSGGGAR